MRTPRKLRLTLCLALATGTLMGACVPEPTVAPDCNVLVFNGSIEIPRRDVDVLIVLDATGRVSLAEQAGLVSQVLRLTSSGDRDGDGALDYEPPVDVHVAFVTGGIGAGCDDEAAIRLQSCTPGAAFIAYGTNGSPPRPTAAQVEAEARCAVALPRPSCDVAAPFEAAARVFNRAMPTGFPRAGAATFVVAIGGASACDGPTGRLDPRSLWDLRHGTHPPVLARVCNDEDALTVGAEIVDAWWGGGPIYSICLPRDVLRDIAGAPDCTVEEEVSWADPDACAALASRGRDSEAIRVDARGHAVCRVRGAATSPDGMPLDASDGFYVDDWSPSAVTTCGEGGTRLAFTYSVDLLRGSTLRVRCTAASSSCGDGERDGDGGS